MSHEYQISIFKSFLWSCEIIFDQISTMQVIILLLLLLSSFLCIININKALKAMLNCEYTQLYCEFYWFIFYFFK